MMRYKVFLILTAVAGLFAFDPSCLVPHPSNPIIPWGHELPDGYWNDPSVLMVNDTFVMYASAKQGLDENADKVRIFRFVSLDGINWVTEPDTAVFSPSTDSSSYDFGAIETPSVVFFNGQYHMYTTSYPGSYDNVGAFLIGHAVSGDGILWTRDSVPALEKTGTITDFNGAVVGEPGAVVFNNKIYMYFTAVGYDSEAGAIMQTIGLTVSEDGFQFDTPRQVLLPDQSVFPRDEGWAGFSTPSAIVLDGNVHLFVDAANDSVVSVLQRGQDDSTAWTQLALYHFHSADGITNWVSDASPIFQREHFDWTAREIRSPAPFVWDDRFYLYFAGDELITWEQDNVVWQKDKWGIGVAVCTLSTASVYDDYRYKNGFFIRKNPSSMSYDIFMDDMENLHDLSIYTATGRMINRFEYPFYSPLKWEPESPEALCCIRARFKDRTITRIIMVQD